MKNVLFTLLVVIIFFLVPFSSCQKDDGIEPGIIYTDYPPEELFTSNQYADSYRCWLDVQSFSKVKDLGSQCNSRWDQEQMRNVFFDCGEWKLIPAKKYWGVKDGIIYLSESVEWYVMSPENSYKGKDLVEKKKTVIANVCKGCQTPFGNEGSLNWFE